MCGTPYPNAAVPGATVTIANRGGNRFLDQAKKFGQGFLSFQQDYKPEATGPSYVIQPQQLNDPQDVGALLRAQILAQLLGGQY